GTREAGHRALPDRSGPPFSPRPNECERGYRRKAAPAQGAELLTRINSPSGVSSRLWARVLIWSNAILMQKRDEYTGLILPFMGGFYDYFAKPASWVILRVFVGAFLVIEGWPKI